MLKEALVQTRIEIFFIPCFDFELAIILYGRLMTSFCLRKVEEVYKVENALSEELKV